MLISSPSLYEYWEQKTGLEGYYKVFQSASFSYKVEGRVHSL
jgi:hypothetical protein